MGVFVHLRTGEIRGTNDGKIVIIEKPKSVGCHHIHDSADFFIEELIDIYIVG